MQKRIKIPNEVSLQIESLQYEYHSRKDWIAYMISNDYSTTSDAFKAYQKEYIEFYTKYNMAKEELENSILRPQIEGKMTGWNLTFATSEVIVDYED